MPQTKRIAVMKNPVRSLDKVDTSTSLAHDWIRLVKIRPTLMAVITALTSFVLASGYEIYWTGVGHTFIAATLLGIGVSMLNQLMEIPIDALMKRTQNRPLPQKRFKPRSVLYMGVGSTILGIMWMGYGTNWVAAFIAFVIALTYIGIYTPLKTQSPWSLWAGAVPGALPPVMGWAACRGTIEMESIALFLIVFCWQFPHFLAIAWVYRDDYSRGGITNLATLDSDGSRVVRQIIVWSGALVMMSFVPFFIGMAGGFYQVTMLLAGGAIMIISLRLTGGALTKNAKSYVLSTVFYLMAFMTSILMDHSIKLSLQ